MTVKEIVQSYLVFNNYDGLFFRDCGCALDNLMHCGNIEAKCKAGYIQKGDNKEHHNREIGLRKGD